MKLASEIAVGVVALLHVYFFVLESFLYRTAYGRRVFGNSREKAEATYVFAQNQGVYNLFLAAGLVWPLVTPMEPLMALQVKTFFLACVAVAGLVGAATVNVSILFAQTVPAGIALALCWL